MVDAHAVDKSFGEPVCDLGVVCVEHRVSPDLIPASEVIELETTRTTDLASPPYKPAAWAVLNMRQHCQCRCWG